MKSPGNDLSLGKSLRDAGSSGGTGTTFLQQRQDIPETRFLYSPDKQNEIFTALMDNLTSGVFMVEAPSGKPLLANRAAQELLGRGILPDVSWQNLSEVYRAHKPGSKAPYPVEEMPIIRGMSGERTHIEDMIVERPDRTEVWLEVFGVPVRNEKGEVWASLVNFHEITERKKRLEEISYLSFRDHLTGLYNRRYFEEEVRRLDVPRNWPLTIVMGDVNGLKLINDSFGHAVGDQLLIKAAQVMQKACRRDEIVSRVGGDEFVLLLPGTESDEAKRLIRRMKGLMSREYVNGMELSVSYGHGTKKEAGETVDAVYRLAEDRMYASKLFEGPSLRSRVFDNIIRMLHNKNTREEMHANQVASVCVEIADALGMSEEKKRTLKAAALLHDIGKITVSDQILEKPGSLSEKELAEMRRHAETGYRILSTSNEMAEYAEIILAHHERWDGTGYPKGLKGEEIPLESRIIAIADAYDALTSERSYQQVVSAKEALEELVCCAGTQFDAALVSVFVKKRGNPTSENQMEK